MVTRRHFLYTAGAAVASAFGLGFYARDLEPYWVEIVHRPMPLENLPPALEGKTLLQISDIHVGPRVRASYLIESLDRARELNPDFVAVTGDFITYRRSAQFEELAKVLKHLPNGRLATIGSLGNHDYGGRWAQMEVAERVTQLARDAGVRVLRNEVAVVEGLQVAGLADFWSPEFGMYNAAGFPPPATPNGEIPESTAPMTTEARGAVKAIAPGLATLVLSHNPDVQDLPIWDGVRAWVLAGHTHGGQVKPPFLPPPILPVKNKRYVSGEYAVAPGRTMYINRGLGHLTQVRFNCRPELTLFTLQRARTPTT
jgi:uncharacterized protein